MKERDARDIAKEFAAEIGLPVRSGTVFVVPAESGFRLLVAADNGWLSGRNLPSIYKGLPVDKTDQIVGQAHLKLKLYA